MKHSADCICADLLNDSARHRFVRYQLVCPSRSAVRWRAADHRHELCDLFLTEHLRRTRPRLFGKRVVDTTLEEAPTDTTHFARVRTKCRRDALQ